MPGVPSDSRPRTGGHSLCYDGDTTASECVWRPARADPAGHLLHPDRRTQRLRGREEGGLALPASTRLRPLLVVDVAQLDASLAGPFAASHQAPPPEHRVPGRDADHLGTE